jgi:DNA ligase-associated metallophosphoesterase
MTHVDVRGQRILLLPERVAVWRSTVLVADAHWGKAAAFRAGAIPVPQGTTRQGLARLDAVLQRTNARRIVFLGDFLHAREGRAPDTLAALAEWRGRLADLEMLLVRGNHDRGAGDPPGELNIKCVNAPVVEAPFVFTHHPSASELGYVLAGHIHPGARLSGPGRQRECLPCFWFGAEGAVMPAFGDFTGLAAVTPVEGDRVFVIAESDVIEVR